MTNDTISQIKAELERINEARAKATQQKWQVSPEAFFEVWTYPETNLIAKLSPKDDFSFGKTSCYNNAEFIALAANEITNLTKALSVAVESLQYHKDGCPQNDELYGWIQTAPISNNSDETLTTIANILSGGKSRVITSREDGK